MELRLVSASSAVGEPADCALVYRLDDIVGLPVVREAHPWAGKTICALRDRLMIEWVFSFSESKRFFEKMRSDITSGLRKSNSKPNVGKSNAKSTIFRVGVVCESGTKLSPCFVERLYDHFKYGPVVVEGLAVTRHHWDALKGAWGRNKDIVWQVSCAPVHEKVASHFDDMFSSRMWLNFDATANASTEEQFRKDPFNSNIEFTDMVLDFESGTAYRKEQKKTYYIRCSHITRSKTNCWFLTHDGYIIARSSYRAAGILPYSVHPVTGEPVFLLGKITYGNFDWCDFGGFKTLRLRRERPRTTAARECYEETLGILGTSAELATALRDFKTNNCFKVVNVDTQYVGHFMRIPYRDYPTIFETALQQNEEYHKIEVDQMKWFPLSALKSAVMMALAEQHRFSVEAVHKDGTLDHSCAHRLRAPLVSTLCIADALNILDSIAAIAKTMHRAQTLGDSAMPYVSIPKPRELHRSREESERNVPSSGAADIDPAGDEFLPGRDELHSTEGVATATHSEVTVEPDTPSELLESEAHETLKQNSARIPLDHSSSDDETDSDDSSDDGSTENDIVDDSREHSEQPLGSTCTAAERTELTRPQEEDNATGKVPSSESGRGDSESPNTSMSSRVKSKLVGFTGGKNSERRQRRRRRRREKRERESGRRAARAGPRKSQTDKRRAKQLLLYGMGAGSFPVQESFTKLL